MHAFSLVPFLPILLSQGVFGADPNDEDKSFVLKHQWTDTPAGWQLNGNPSPDQQLTLYIGLKQNGFDTLVEQLLEVSDPDHKRYGDHLSKDAVDNLVSPSQETINAVDDWLQSNGVDPSNVERSDARDWIYVNASVRTVERMLQTRYHIFRHEETQETILRTLSYSLPESLQEHVELVSPTTAFSISQAAQFSSKKLISRSMDASNEFGQTVLSPSLDCNTSAVTPNCLRSFYGTADYVPSAINKNAVGVLGYLEQFPNFSDLKEFMTKFREDINGSEATFKLIQINGGGNNQSDPGDEATLDIQYVEGFTFPTPTMFYSVGGRAPFIPDENTPTNNNEPYLDWLKFMNKQHNNPQVITTSYGDIEQTVPRDYATRVCNELVKLGARGMSIIYSSGDDGVGSGNCTTNDGTGRKLFQPNFPASCPWITSIGGTANFTTETAVSFSGGGFSRYFDQPEYQKSAVEQYLDNIGDKYKGLFNSKGRGYPDAAAQGSRYVIVKAGTTFLISGTSASGPTFSGIITLLNDYRLSHGKPPLGFLNPLLYNRRHAARIALNDITLGNNPGCGTDGFEAMEGWDPVTGLGTPNFKKLQQLL